MMGQIKYQNGYEIQFSTHSGRARISDRHQRIVLDWTTYEACERWLADRGLRRAGN